MGMVLRAHNSKQIHTNPNKYLFIAEIPQFTENFFFFFSVLIKFTNEGWRLGMLPYDTHLHTYQNEWNGMHHDEIKNNNTNNRNIFSLFLNR